MKTKIKYIGNKITYSVLKDFITSEQLTENDKILLNPVNFDDIVIEYREFYNESIEIPHKLLNVLIEEAKNSSIPQDRIGIVSE